LACHLRRNAFESIKTRYVPNYIREQTAPTDVLKNLSGLSLCFLRIKYCLSVGAFFERPRANRRACSDVRPYRVLGDFSDKDITLSVLCFFVISSGNRGSPAAAPAPRHARRRSSSARRQQPRRQRQRQPLLLRQLLPLPRRRLSPPPRGLCSSSW